MKQGVKFENRNEVYSPKDISKVLSMAVNEDNLFGNNKGVYYYNIPCSFDIEVTSFYRLGEVQYSYADYIAMCKREPKLKTKFEKLATMYVWQFGINGFVIVGRYWHEFMYIVKNISSSLQLGERRILVCYVHNLSYEFQFIRNLFSWITVFSNNERVPIYARTTDFIEFRCSYILSGYSLAKLGEQLQTYKVSKMVGDLDYSLPRNSLTPLTEKELGYCVNDVKVVMSYIQERIEIDKGITHIPLTKTGYVRKYCRKQCFEYKDENGKRRRNNRYLDNISSLQINTLNEFNTLLRSFQGGFTHCNWLHNGAILENVASYDFTSSYPYVMVSEKFPMSFGRKVLAPSIAMVNEILNNDKFCCIFDCAFWHIVSTNHYEHYISTSKCRNSKGIVEDNGRVAMGDYIETTITNIDYDIIKRFYKWDNCEITAMYVYRKEYLPTEFIKSILTLYEKKTTLKGVAGKEIEYMSSKEMINSCYGMTVTNPLKDEILYEENQWGTKELSSIEKSELLFKYNNSRNRFLFFPWGVFVTAYARYNLFSAISILGNDYVYSDTDSVKILNYQSHLGYFEEYNKGVIAKLQNACKYHNIDFALCSPRTIKGVTKMLGVWDFEGVYDKFKTLGAKRYMVFKDGEYSLTVSGLNKKVAIPYLVKKYGDNIMEMFTDTLYIEPIGTGKNIHTYIDTPKKGIITDYLGNTCNFAELSAVHLEPTDYTLNLSEQYINYLKGRTTIKIM